MERYYRLVELVKVSHKVNDCHYFMLHFVQGPLMVQKPSRKILVTAEISGETLIVSFNYQMHCVIQFRVLWLYSELVTIHNIFSCYQVLTLHKN